MLSTSCSMDSSQSTQSIVEEYQSLLEKSHRLFAGVRNLPGFGLRVWGPFFRKVFEGFGRLWTFQQVHRSLLEDPERYGLKRWEIGDIASRIGQLFFQYHLRTSDVAYLWQSYYFYDAIRSRGYFEGSFDSKGTGAKSHALRFLPRFVIVALLLRRKETYAAANAAASTFSMTVSEYIRVCSPRDSAQWKKLRESLMAFCDRVTATCCASGQALPECSSVADGLLARFSAVEAQPLSNHKNSGVLRLRAESAAILCGENGQLRVGDLSLDMFRLLEAINVGLSGPEGCASDFPLEKFVLWSPVLSQVLVFLASAFHELSSEGILLLFMTGKGLRQAVADDEDICKPCGGIVLSDAITGGAAPVRFLGTFANAAPAAGNGSSEKTSSRGPERSPDGDLSRNAPSGTVRLPKEVLIPNDLFFLLRKPLFFVVQSDAAADFRSFPFPNPFGEPFLALCSPIQPPIDAESDAGQPDSLFLLFLSSLIDGFIRLVDVADSTRSGFDAQMWQGLIERCAELVLRRLRGSPDTDGGVLRLLQDGLIGNLVFRFLFFRASCALHKKFQAHPDNLPQSVPPFPPPVLFDSALIDCIFELAGELGVRESFVGHAEAAAGSEKIVLLS